MAEAPPNPPNECRDRLPVQTIRVRVFDETNYTEITIDWANIGPDGEVLFTELGRVSDIPANRTELLCVWKGMDEAHPIGMIAFNRDRDDPDMTHNSRQAIIELLRRGHNNFVLGVSVRVSNRDSRLAVVYSLVHEDLIEAECSRAFCHYAHVRAIINKKRSIVVDQRLNNTLYQGIRELPAESRNRLLNRLGIAQFIHMTCKFTVLNPIDPHQPPIDQEHICDRARS